MTTAKLRQDAKAIFEAGVHAADPRGAVHEFVGREKNCLTVAGRPYDLDDFGNVYVVGAGKAAAAMAAAVEEILGDKITAGVINVKYGHLDHVHKLELHEAGHPVPDKAGQQGVLEMVQLLEKAGEKDLFICLISGGGSALLPLPADGISLQDKQEVTRQLLACGATIDEINTVRKHISKIKGGQLTRLAYPAQLVTLILSDVVGDPLDAIASGPTVPDSTTFQEVEQILRRHEILKQIPATIQTHLQKGVRGEIPETPKAGDGMFAKTQNVIVASNFEAIAAARDQAAALGYNTLILSSFVQGETREVAHVHAAIAREIVSSGHPVEPPACIISGGETTVTLRGTGKGGRNQEFALAAAIVLDGLRPVVILSGGTDGTDGPTDAAGAFCDGDTVRRAQATGLEAATHLSNNDAYPFFKALGDLLITGPTNTNVMDLRLILVGERQ
ncbi:MAG: glycerate kinase [bacterium]